MHHFVHIHEYKPPHAKLPLQNIFKILSLNPKNRNTEPQPNNQNLNWRTNKDAAQLFKEETIVALENCCWHFLPHTR
jgi:hypothetical protein